MNERAEYDYNDNQGSQQEIVNEQDLKEAEDNLSDIDFQELDITELNSAEDDLL